jgi:hypothetical protein
LFGTLASFLFFLGGSIGGTSTTVVVCEASPAVPEPSVVWAALLLATRCVCQMEWTMEPPALSEPCIISFGCTITGYTFVACRDHMQLIQYVRSILKQIVYHTANYWRGCWLHIHKKILDCIYSNIFWIAYCIRSNQEHTNII